MITFNRTNYFYYDYYYFGEAVLWINICTASGSLTSVSATETSVPSCSDGFCPASCRDRLTMFSASHLCEESNTKDRPFHSALIQPRLHYRLGPPAGRRCALPRWAIDDVLWLKGQLLLLLSDMIEVEKVSAFFTGIEPGPPAWRARL